MGDKSKRFFGTGDGKEQSDDKELAIKVVGIISIVAIVCSTLITIFTKTDTIGIGSIVSHAFTCVGSMAVGRKLFNGRKPTE